MAKTLCDWSKKDIAKNIGELRSLVQDPQYVCGKCARACSMKRALCRPVALPGAKSTHVRKAG